MHALLTVLVCIGLAIAFDWVGTERMAAMVWSFDYRYWPLSKLRTVSVLVLATALSIVGLFMKPNAVDPPQWPLLVIGPALLVWWVVAWLDFMAHRRTGYRKPRRPPRYSDRDFDEDD